MVTGSWSTVNLDVSATPFALATTSAYPWPTARVNPSESTVTTVESELAATLLAQGKTADAEELYGDASVPEDLGIERWFQGHADLDAGGTIIQLEPLKPLTQLMSMLMLTLPPLASPLALICEGSMQPSSSASTSERENWRVAKVTSP